MLHDMFEGPFPKVPVRRLQRFAAGVALVLALLLLVGIVDYLESFADSSENPPRTPVTPAVTRPQQAAPLLSPLPVTYTFSEHPRHPDRLYRPYFGMPLVDVPPALPSASLLPSFRELMSQYAVRQGFDDNFTMRISDNRTNELLEIFVLEDEREAYKKTGTANWGTIDKLRREETRRLVDKYRQRGIPRDYISVKWGRLNQVLEARKREAPFIDYEVRLAQYLGLSLLATEIGTVETFNDDRLVSSVGARGRYQMMPYILREREIEHYEMTTAYGSKVNVYEEWHPLLTMEPAFKLLRGYVNAVGHEVPGISAYHSGPANLFSLFQLYLTEGTSELRLGSTVMDAFMWGVTEGFETVSDKTSYRSYSRGYIPSGYGALLATDHLPIDPSQTFVGERVQIAPGKQVYLGDLLEKLESASLYWGPGMEDLTPYERFRKLNPHILLPNAAENDGAVPARGNLLLRSTEGGSTVRFFLPLGATEVLTALDFRVLNPEATQRFDPNTYMLPQPGELTRADQEYALLVEDIEHFGFTQSNMERLTRLKAAFERLARENPSHYRQTQLDIIRTHHSLWTWGAWKPLAEAATAARGDLRMPVRPPLVLGPPSLLPARPPRLLETPLINLSPSSGSR